jgi:hypothetical protein
MVISLITNLIKAICTYFELKNKSFYYDILDKSRKRQNSLVEEIESLRDKGDAKSTDAADVLVLQLVEERKWIKHISNTCFEIKSGDRN